MQKRTNFLTNEYLMGPIPDKMEISQYVKLSLTEAVLWKIFKVYKKVF
jgi:hypothetical protein